MARRVAVAAPRSLEQFATDERARKGPMCWTCRLPKDIRARIEKACLEDPAKYTFSVLASWLEELGIRDASKTSVEAHFRKKHMKAA